MEHIEQFLQQYGYFAIFGLLMLGIVGPLIPDETILVAAGIFVQRGQLHFLPAVLAGFLGSACGITLSYLIGRHGFAFLKRHSKHIETLSVTQLPRVEQWFKRFGPWTIFFGYFVAGVRHFTALFAGISGMSWRALALPAYCGAIVWVVAFVSIGALAGEQWSRVGGTVDKLILVAAISLVIAIAVFFKLRYRRPSP